MPANGSLFNVETLFSADSPRAGAA